MPNREISTPRSLCIAKSGPGGLHAKDLQDTAHVRATDRAFAQAPAALQARAEVAARDHCALCARIEADDAAAVHAERARRGGTGLRWRAGGGERDHKGGQWVA